MKILITYADDNMKTSQDLCILSASLVGGITDSYRFSPEMLKKTDPGFYERYKHILEAPCRNDGKGFWLWKPFICEWAARRMDEGTYVIYADAGIEFIDSIDTIIANMTANEEDIFLFGNEHRHTKYCKRNVLKHMIPFGCDTSTKSVQASVIIFKVTSATRKLMQEWLGWSTIPGYIDQSDNIGADYEREYSDHRNDQAILSCLAIWHGIPLHWWPAQYGYCIRNDYPHDTYPQLFYHHRYREFDWAQTGHTVAQFMSLSKNI